MDTGSIPPPVADPVAAAPAALSSATARYLISDLCAYLDTYLPPEQVRQVYRAYLFGADAHQGQKRMSGEPYIYHPIAVTRILAGMRMDYKCLMAALLHDVIEDTATAKEELAAEFDNEIAELVDGVSKLTKINFRTRAEAQAENFRKMILAMTKDMRIILIKLADRLHNMRTLGAVRPQKARRIARETLDIYAPIANRLGISSVRRELENLGMAAYCPWRYNVLSNALRSLRGSRRELMVGISTSMEARLQQEGLPAEITGREKHLYSIYRKMRDKRLSFSELMDVFGFRILVDTVDQCYRVLGVMHGLYKPLPGRFKDYIAIPKANGYQSLHTVLIGPGGTNVEVQIRTRAMHQVAEHGIAAHWRYKSNGGDALPSDAAAEWVRNLLEVQKGSGSSLEFLEHVKVDLFPDEVYVFTPRGQIRVLPKGATVVDFAYGIHSDVGNRCVMARVDRVQVPLRTRLRNGQTVEIITRDDAQPNPIWLEFVVTGKARAAIRGYLKRLERDEAIAVGRRLLDRELEAKGAGLDQVGAAQIERTLDEIKADSLETLLQEIGLGNRMPRMVARSLLVHGNSEGEAAPAGRLNIRGSEGFVVSYGKCCGPIPGDPIVGAFRPGKGLVVHQQTCPNVGEFRKGSQDWVEVEWDQAVTGEFSTSVEVDCGNKRGMLATIASTIAAESSNIEDVRSLERDGLSSKLRFVITVRDRDHLAHIVRRLRAIPEVLRISRGQS
jgi:GTP pyrophosphokinase